VISTAVIPHKEQKRTLYNITQNINNLNRGMLPDDWYYRIYYDASLPKQEGLTGRMWRDFVRSQSKTPKVQLVEFDCARTEKVTAANLARIRPLFSTGSADLIAIIEPDRMMTEPYVKELREFLDSNQKMRTLSSKLELGKLMSKITLKPSGWIAIQNYLKQTGKTSEVSITNFLKVILDRDGVELSKAPKEKSFFVTLNFASYYC